MNFDGLIGWALGVVLALTAVDNIDSIQRFVLKEQAKLIFESRTATWGSPNFLMKKEAKKDRLK